MIRNLCPQRTAYEVCIFPDDYTYHRVAPVLDNEGIIGDKAHLKVLRRYRRYLKDTGITSYAISRTSVTCDLIPRLSIVAGRQTISHYYREKVSFRFAFLLPADAIAFKLRFCG